MQIESTHVCSESLANKYRDTQRPPFPQTKSQHNSFKLLCCEKLLTTQHFNTVMLSFLWQILPQHNGSGFP